jgi:hypothetical protein
MVSPQMKMMMLLVLKPPLTCQKEQMHMKEKEELWQTK